MYTEEEALAHYGVKGMRWGVRRSPEQLKRARKERKGGKFTETPSDMQSKDSKNVKTAQSKIQKKKRKPDDLSALSNEEIQAVIRRMNLEQQYSKLTPGATGPGAKVASVGKDYTVKIVKGVGDQAAKEVSKVAFNEILKLAVKK